MHASACPLRDGRPLFLAHVQKTGGTSVREVLARAVPAERFYPNADDIERAGVSLGDPSPEADSFAALPRERLAGMWIVADHLAPYLAAQMPVRPWLAIVVRHPVERALSHLAHVHWFDRRHAARPLAELFDNLAIRRRVVDNYQTRFLSATDLVEARGPTKPRVVSRADLDRALAWIEAADVILPTERLADGVDLLGRTVGLPLAAPPRRNAAQSWLTEQMADPALHARIAPCVALDDELYRRALARFEVLRSRPGGALTARSASSP